MPNDAKTLKPLFQLDPELVFLNHGSYGACPREVMLESQRWQAEMERNPVEFLGRRSAALLRAAREQLAAYLGAQADDLVFVPNATTGVNIVAQSLPLRAGDEVVSTDLEYGACDNTWDFVAARSGARRVVVPIPLPFDAASFTERIWAAVTPRTRVLFLSHLCSETALILPIQTLVERARAAGIWSVVDGAHAPAQLPLQLDALGVDFYTGNCHKWLCAPKGSAFLHARRPLHPLLHAPTISWGYTPGPGRPGGEAYLGHSLLEQRMQWLGTRDLSAFLSVPAAIEFQARHDWDSVRQRWCELSGLAAHGTPEDFAQMVPLPVPRNLPAATLKQRLFDEHRIEVPVIDRAGRLSVRASFQGYNSEADAEALLAALRRVCGI